MDSPPKGSSSKPQSILKEPRNSSLSKLQRNSEVRVESEHVQVTPKGVGLVPKLMVSQDVSATKALGSPKYGKRKALQS